MRSRAMRDDHISMHVQDPFDAALKSNDIDLTVEFTTRWLRAGRVTSTPPAACTFRALCSAICARKKAGSRTRASPRRTPAANAYKSSPVGTGADVDIVTVFPA